MFSTMGHPGLSFFLGDPSVLLGNPKENPSRHVGLLAEKKKRQHNSHRFSQGPGCDCLTPAVPGACGLAAQVLGIWIWPHGQCVPRQAGKSPFRGVFLLSHVEDLLINLQMRYVFEQTAKVVNRKKHRHWHCGQQPPLPWVTCSNTRWYGTTQGHTGW